MTAVDFDPLAPETFEIIPGVGHFGWLDHEERIFRAILDGV